MLCRGRVFPVLICTGIIVISVGCNSPTGIAVQLVGKAVDPWMPNSLATS